MATKVPVAATEQASVGFSKVTKRLREGQSSSAPEQLRKLCLSGCSGRLDLNHALGIKLSGLNRSRQFQSISLLMENIQSQQ